MQKFILSGITLLLLFAGAGHSQKPFIAIAAETGFKTNDDATSVYDSVADVFRLNLQNGSRIYRKIYDTSFNLLDEYSFTSTDILLSGRLSPRANFITPVCSRKGYYEVYATGDGILIYKPDFKEKKDSLVGRFTFDHIKKGGEKLLSILPDAEDLKILTYSKEFNTLKLYQWLPDDSTKTCSFVLPQKSMSKEEEKIYDKDCQVKLNSLWNAAFVSSRINSIQSLPKGNHIFYAGPRIYILMPIPYSMGRYVITVDLDKNELSTHNYFINSLRENAGDNNYIKKEPVSMVFDSVLVIQNSSHYRFEYFFYNINTHDLIKKYSVPVADSIYQLVHSSFTQKGTFGSRNQEKDITRERAFMRKINGSFWYITLSSQQPDSVVFTLAALKYTEGIGGTLLSIGTGTIGFMANIHVGNLQVIPYLTSHRYKLFFAHSKFSTGNFEPSGDSTVTTALDEIIDTFETKELASSSSFLIQKRNEVFIGVLNTDKNMFDIYKFRNSR